MFIQLFLSWIVLALLIYMVAAIQTGQEASHVMPGPSH